MLVRSVLGATLALTAASHALVLPGGAGQQIAFSLPDAGHLVHDAADKVTSVLEDSWNLIQGVARDTATGKQWMTLKHDSLPGYALRVTEPKLCDSGVKQYSGYLDVGQDKHFFFWFFESRRKPSKAPVVLWLNGGPGCSSTTGLLFENGPCNIRANGTKTELNPFSWNEEANMLYLDSPVGVGGSWADKSTVNNTPQTAEDVFAFLELFLAKFKKYAQNDLHISGESYAGTYLPHIASVIHRESLALKELGNAAPLPRLAFSSVLIGNGLSDPLVQFGHGVHAYACDSPQAVFDPAGPECANIAAKAPQCARLIESCYKTGSRFSCTPAGLYCWSQLYGDFQKLGLNPYDVRKKCDKEGEDGPLCYREMGWIENYLNQADVQAELGMREGLEFKSCNMQINQAFLLQGDGMHYAAGLLTPLLADGIRVLFYAGVEDFMCNYLGIEMLVEELASVFKAEYNAAKFSPYITLDGKKEAGHVKVAGAQGFTAGNLAFVKVKNAGHMVPTDVPDVALDLFARWIHNTPLVLSKPDNATVSN